MVFILPVIMHDSDPKVEVYLSLLLSLVEPATNDTPAVLPRAGVMKIWRSEALIKFWDAQEGGRIDIIIR